jgi:hypothetical protein
MKISFYYLLGLFLLFVQADIQAQKKKTTAVKPAVFNAADRPKNLSDTALLELVQKQTFRYFWEFGHPVSGMSRERSNVAYDYGDEVVTTGGTGFGIMAMIVAAERKWQPRDSVAARLLKWSNFCQKQIITTAFSHIGSMAQPARSYPLAARMMVAIW